MKPKPTSHLLSLAIDFFDNDTSEFVRARTCGADCGYPAIDTLWHALIDLWRQRKDREISEDTYQGSLEIIQTAYMEMWPELCAQERFEID